VNNEGFNLIVDFNQTCIRGWNQLSLHVELDFADIGAIFEGFLHDVSILLAVVAFDFSELDSEFLEGDVGLLLCNWRFEFSFNHDLLVGPLLLIAVHVDGVGNDRPVHLELRRLNHLLALGIIDVDDDPRRFVLVANVFGQVAAHSAWSIAAHERSFGLTGCFLSDALLGWWIATSDLDCLLHSVDELTFWETLEGCSLQTDQISLEFVIDRELTHQFSVEEERRWKALWKRNREGVFDFGSFLLHLHRADLGELLLDVDENVSLLSAIRSGHEPLLTAATILMCEIYRPVHVL